MTVIGLSFPTQRQAVLPTLTMALLLTAVMLLPETVRQSLLLDREAVMQGQHWWQLWTSQLVHHDWPHFALNLLGLGVCWALFIDEQMGWRRWLGLPFIMLGSSLAQLYFDPQVRFYAGFSGTLYGVFAFCACSDVLHKRWLGGLILIGVIGKVIYDSVFLPELSGLAFAAHGGGVATGLVLAFLCKILILRS